MLSSISSTTKLACDITVRLHEMNSFCARCSRSLDEYNDKIEECTKDYVLARVNIMMLFTDLIHFRM